MKEPQLILTDAYEKAIKVAANNSFDNFELTEIRSDIDTFIDKIETDKSLRNGNKIKVEFARDEFSA